jgi:hypothetical protein
MLARSLIAQEQIHQFTPIPTKLGPCDQKKILEKSKLQKKLS